VIRIAIVKGDPTTRSELTRALTDAGFDVRPVPGAPQLDVLAPDPRAHGLRLDPAGHGVRLGARFEPLTPTELRLLGALLARPGDVVRRAELISAAWPEGAIVHANTLDTYIRRLRRKLRTLGAEAEIATARGVGYALRSRQGVVVDKVNVSVLA
jgi:DNA-binding response OmpR family regulator